MSLHPLAGQPVPADMLENIPRICAHYYSLQPDLNDPAQRVSFGTSGHRGAASLASFNESHILAICQAVAEYRAAAGIGLDRARIADRQHVAADRRRRVRLVLGDAHAAIIV